RSLKARQKRNWAIRKSARSSIIYSLADLSGSYWRILPFREKLLKKALWLPMRGWPPKKHVNSRAASLCLKYPVFRVNWQIVPHVIRKSVKFISLRVTQPVDLQNQDAIAISKRSCRCAGKSLTLKKPVLTGFLPTLKSATSLQHWEQESAKNLIWRKPVTIKLSL